MRRQFKGNDRKDAEVATQQQGKRQWIIWRADYTDDYGNDTGFRSAVENELAAWEHVGHRLGRGLVAAPIRQELVVGQYETTGWLFREIFVPAPKAVEEPVQAVAPDVPDLSEFDGEPEPAEEPATAA